MGVGGDWSFDDDVASFGCTVFAFDPSIHEHTGEQGNRILFLHFGLGHKNELDPTHGWEVRTLEFYVRQLRHSRRQIHYLKMDIEGEEWEVLRQQTRLGRNSTLFTHVQQLGLELHVREDPKQYVEWWREQYQSFLALQRLGFYPFMYHPNEGVSISWVIPGMTSRVPPAFEVVWLKTGCV